MIGIRELRAGVKVFTRHVRNAQGNPERLRWVLARTWRILLGGKAGGILQRHAVMNDLYANYPEWVQRYDTLDPAGRKALRTRASEFAQQPLISVVLPCYNAGLQY